MNCHYYIVDVFTKTPYNGAQIAVFADADGISDEQMLLLARELNLAESVFITTVGTDATRRLKVYSPTRQLEFSGHAIIAAAFVLGKFDLVELEPLHTRISLEQMAGVNEVVITRQENNELFIQFSRYSVPVVDRFVPENHKLAEMLSLPESEMATRPFQPMLVACEQTYLVLPVQRFEAVRRAVFNFTQWSSSVAPLVAANEILIFSPKSDLTSSNFHARLLGPGIGIKDDPPIGSSMPAFAGYLGAHKHIREGITSFVIDRGTLATRKSVLSVDLIKRHNDKTEVRVGGPAVVVGEGTLRLEK